MSDSGCSHGYRKSLGGWNGTLPCAYGALLRKPSQCYHGFSVNGATLCKAQVKRERRFNYITYPLTPAQQQSMSVKGRMASTCWYQGHLQGAVAQLGPLIPDSKAMWKTSKSGPGGLSAPQTYVNQRPYELFWEVLGHCVTYF